MATFTLLVVPDGKALLTTPERLSDQESAAIRETVRGWRDGEWPVLIVPDCDVVQVAQIDFDLGVEAAV